LPLIEQAGLIAPTIPVGFRFTRAKAAFVLGAVAEQPDMALAELQGKLKERGKSAGIATLWRFFQRHRITHKKRLRTPPSKAGRT
jgi:hypothetical protein